MTEHQLTRIEAADLGTRLDAICETFSIPEQEFLKAAFRLAAAAAWVHTHVPLVESTIRELILDIYQAGDGSTITLNPLPIPIKPKG
jgi:hypothetical protein